MNRKEYYIDYWEVAGKLIDWMASITITIAAIKVIFFL